MTRRPYCRFGARLIGVGGKVAITIMDARLRTLENIAALALHVRALERELVNSADPRLVMERLKQARLDLDAELSELGLLDRER